MREHLKVVVWPREPIQHKRKINYRYVVVGMLVTDTPLTTIHDNEIVIDSSCSGIKNLLESLPQRLAKQKTSDAADVLVSLRHL